MPAAPSKRPSWRPPIAAASGWWANQIVWSVALLVALYTVAALRPRRVALAAAAVLSVACVVAALHVLRGGWPLAAFALIAFASAALGLGLYSAARHALVAELQERARRLELERDQQGQLALRDTRHLLGVLREDQAATELTPAGDVSVDDLIERVRGTGLPVHYQITGDAQVGDPAVRLTLYRVIQEALTNTMKHAGRGARATVRVDYAPTEVRVLSEDDGQGSEGLPLPASGHGLDGMRERVRAVGGEMSSGPRAPHGWTVAARLPVSEAS